MASISPRSIAFLLLALLCGCGANDIMEKVVPEKDKSVARYYLDLARDGNVYPIERDLDPSLSGTPNLHETLVKMGALIPKGNPVSTKVIGYNVFLDSAGGSTKNVSFEFQYPKVWIVANVVLKTTGDRFTIAGINVHPEPDSLEHLNRFTFAGKNPLKFPIQYLILVGAVLVPIFIVYTLVKCIKTKLRKKWLWIVFILFGVGKISVNWTSGEWWYSIVNIQLLGSGAVAAFYGPWVISTSLPLGAILFLFLRKRLAGVAPPLEEAPPPPADPQI